MSEEKDSNDKSEKGHDSSQHEQEESEHDVGNLEEQIQSELQKSLLNSGEGSNNNSSNGVEEDLDDKASSVLEVSHEKKNCDDKEISVQPIISSEKEQVNIASEEPSLKSEGESNDVELIDEKESKNEISSDKKSSTNGLQRDQVSKKSESNKK